MLITCTIIGENPPPEHVFYRRLAGGTMVIQPNRQGIEMSHVIANVMSGKGNCENHKVGDEFEIGEKTPPNVCSWAFHTPFPFTQVMLYGGSFPWARDLNKATTPCLDPENAVVLN